MRYSGIEVPERYGASMYRDLSEEEKRTFLKEEEGYDPRTIDAIIEGEVFMGMSTKQVLYSWGKPDDINRTVGSWGVHEQWVYDRGDYSSQYLYFEDGELNSWQD